MVRLWGWRDGMREPSGAAHPCALHRKRRTAPRPLLGDIGAASARDRYKPDFERKRTVMGLVRLMFCA